MPVREFESIEDLKELEGQEVSASDWVEITQYRINQFAEVTLDPQWIHVDAERCKDESPFGTTIAHGYLTLSLFPHFFLTSIAFARDYNLIVNAGLNRLRFTSPVKVDSRLRGCMTVKSVDAVKGGWKVTWKTVIEIEGEEKPACIAEVIYRYMD